MNKNYLLILTFILAFLFSCDKFDNLYIGKGEIIAFNPDKCYCCWGWEIRIGDDIIKSDDEIIGEIIGYDIVKPIPVFLEIGRRKSEYTSCSNSFKYADYFEVRAIKEIK